MAADGRSPRAGALHTLEPHCTEPRSPPGECLHCATNLVGPHFSRPESATPCPTPTPAGAPPPPFYSRSRIFRLFLGCWCLLEVAGICWGDGREGGFLLGGFLPPRRKLLVGLPPSLRSVALWVVCVAGLCVGFCYPCGIANTLPLATLRRTNCRTLSMSTRCVCVAASRLRAPPVFLPNHSMVLCVWA